MELYRTSFVIVALFIVFFGDVCPAYSPQAARNPKAKRYSDLIHTELDFLAHIPNRKTGSKGHRNLIGHIKQQLRSLGLKIHSNTWYFDYNKSPTTLPKLTIGHKDIEVSSAVPYSGNTDAEGVTGPLISLIGPNVVPDWSQARGGIAVVNITNAPQNRSADVPLWPGSPAWKASYVQVPASTANALIINLTDAAEAGVKGVVYLWDHISTGLAKGQYGPFWTNYQGIPALFVSPEAASDVIKAAARRKKANLRLTGKLIPNRSTKNVWVIVPGTKRPHESVLINTHTDGVNIGEENGHIALLAYARSLVANPPMRTTILAFITGHIHSAPFSYSTHRSTSRWLADNPKLWNGLSQDSLTGVFGSCVEHLGLRDIVEDLAANTYTLTKSSADEVLFAATKQLAALTFKEWTGAVPNFTRVINPLANGTPSQGGEGLPFLLEGIPEISLVTAPGWLLQEFPASFDERRLIDKCAVQRQIDSFERIWRRVDGMNRKALGHVP